MTLNPPGYDEAVKICQSNKGTEQAPMSWFYQLRAALLYAHEQRRTEEMKMTTNDIGGNWELFNDGKKRWVLTRDYDEDSAPVFETITDAYNFLVDEGLPFTLKVHSANHGRRSPIRRGGEGA